MTSNPFRSAQEIEDKLVGSLPHEEIPVREDLETDKDSGTQERRRDGPRRCYRHSLVYFLLFGLVIIVIVILIPTVFLKDDGPRWKSTGFSLHNDENQRKNQYQQQSAHYGKDVALSGDGTRLVFSGQQATEVWDWQKGAWSFQNRIQTPHARVDFQVELSSEGSRLLHTLRGQVVVHTDANGDGRNWTQLGETLNDLSYLNLTRPNLVLNMTEDDLSVVRAYPFAESISFSKDGSTIAVGSSWTNSLDCSFSSEYYYRCKRRVGVVQIFRHVDSLKLRPH